MYFPPEELKNGQRGKSPKHYRIRLPQSKAKWIDQWREELALTLGQDFEEVCPYVFPSKARKYDESGRPVWKEMKEGGFYLLIRNACLEVRGHPYRPHKIRSAVAEFIIGHKEATMRDTMQAAEMLGDNIETVLKYYNKPDIQKYLDDGYFKKLEEN